MGMVESALRSPNPTIPANNQEFVLYHTEVIEAYGFTNHLKLPHYVTFQAGLREHSPDRQIEENEAKASRSGRRREGIAMIENLKFQESFNYAYIDEFTKKEIRRKTLKAVCIPGYQVPYSSPEMPISRGWGTGGLHLTLSLIGPDDVVKVIDQGSDASVNACNLRLFIKEMAHCGVTFDTAAATIIQSRHRVPEEILTEKQILVLAGAAAGDSAQRREARGQDTA